MMPDLDDLLVVAGLVCLAVGVWLAWGVVVLLLFVGSVLLVAGVLLAVRGDGSTKRVDRSEGG